MKVKVKKENFSLFMDNEIQLKRVYFTKKGKITDFSIRVFV